MYIKLSVIIPQYKTELYISKCVDSVRFQTLKNIEIILIDDGSPDKCGAICDEYAKKDERVKVIHKENGGYSSAVNAGLEIAQGEYIGIVDGDDYIKEDMYETLYKLAKKYDADVVECNVFTVKGNVLTSVCQEKGILTGDNIFALNKLLAWGWNSVLWNKIYRKDLLINFKLPYAKKYSDSIVVYKIFLSLHTYVYTSESKYFYLTRPGSVMSQKEYTIDKLEGLEVHEERFRYLKERVCDLSIINQVEYRYFLEILLHYHFLCRSKGISPRSEYKIMIKNHLLNNFESFTKNPLLKNYRIWMYIFKNNSMVFQILYGLYLPLYKNLYCLVCSCIRFIRNNNEKIRAFKCKFLNILSGG